MSGELRVITEHVRKLSATQAEAASQIAAAASVADGVSTSMWASHGLICAPTNIAVAAAELTRRNACTAMQSSSTGLSEKLNTAAEKYDQTDAHAAAKIGKCIPPHRG
jgi:Excreted virulence factor EspC, type VII ESX diderm